MEGQSDYEKLLGAISFASIRHRCQRRKDDEASPYINHPIEVAELLARVGGVTDVVILQGAILHDTIEDTGTTVEEIEAIFGVEVCRIVMEVTDDKSLPKTDRKRLQIEHARHLSHGARLVKLADKISNVRALSEAPPAGWSLDRRQEYLDWSEMVVAGLRGCSPALEDLYDQVLEQCRRTVGR